LHSGQYAGADQSQRPISSTASAANLSGSLSSTSISPLGGGQIASPTNANPTDNAILQKYLREILRQIGVKEMPPLERYLHEEIASGDKGRILRAFSDAIYSQYWPMSDVIPVLRGFLYDSNPFVRYLAAQDLLTVGDNGGYSVLLALVQSSTRIDGIGADVRVQAADTLAQYRQTGAAQAIYDLYQQTKDGNLISGLATLGSPQAAALTEARGYFSDAPSLAFYGRAGATQFIPQITSTFSSSKDLDVKAAAAWALATMTGNQDAINYLVQQAQLGLNDPSHAGSLYIRNVVEYLGTITTPQAKQTLEAALGGTDPVVVETAAVNLILNQGGSERVNQMAAAELTGHPNLLGADMVLTLAPQLLNDPLIQSAGTAFSQHDGSGAWQRFAVDRKNWPVYSWADSYVVKFKK
jgi:HEAT repeat protein